MSDIKSKNKTGKDIPEEKPVTPSFSLLDNCNRLQRMCYRKKAYLKISLAAIKKKVPIRELIRTQFPFLFPLAAKPIFLGIEYTNSCNLHCVYCKYPGIPPHEKGFMSRELFARVLKEIDDIAINRIIIGGGEATLHPDFGDFTQRLAKKKKFLSLVTNGQWQDENIPGAIVDSSIDLVEISLDAGGKEKYENSRVGASFDRLAANLERLWSARKKAKSAMMINIRLMIRPSTQKKAGHEYRYLEKFADMVMPQLLLKYRDHSYEHDIFISEQYAENRIPRCKRPFNNFIIKYNGDIPLCAPSYNKQVIGNIDRSSLRELWTGEVINRYRQGILKKDPNLAPQCRGCAGT